MTKNKQEKLLATARALIGKPYVYGTNPDNAPNTFDCSSFTQYVFKQLGIEIPRSSILQAADPNGKEIVPTTDFSNLEIGDLLFMRGTRGHYRDDLFPGREMYIGHVVIYTGNENCIHAWSKGDGVVEIPLREVLENPAYSIRIVKRFK